jgi:hypothetical protein
MKITYIPKCLIDCVNSIMSFSDMELSYIEITSFLVKHQESRLMFSFCRIVISYLTFSIFPEVSCLKLYLLYKTLKLQNLVP